MTKLVQTIYWGDITSGGAYLYGSEIDFYGREVRFENFNFPSGKPIKRWRSRTNYQGNRTTPEVPLLIPGQRYRIFLEAVSIPERRIYLQINFLNRHGEKIDYFILKGQEGEFTYPDEAFTYQVILYSAGCESLIFQSFSIFEVGDSLNEILFLPTATMKKVEELPTELNLISPIL